MITRKMERVDSEVQKALADIIQFELNDPRLNNVFISVLDTQVTKDMKYCKAFVSVFPIEKSEEVILALKSSEPYIKKCLSRKILIRNIPSISFLLHQGVEHSSKIEKILKDLEKTEE